jgi:hypothetical protein
MDSLRFSTGKYGKQGVFYPEKPHILGSMENSPHISAGIGMLKPNLKNSIF